MSEEHKYSIDPEHLNLSYEELSQIPKYKSYPDIEIIKLLPMAERNRVVEKKLKNLDFFQRYVGKGYEYSKLNNWKLKDVPKEFDTIVIIDLFIEDLKGSLKDIAEFQICSFIISTLLNSLYEDVQNPLMKNRKKTNKYFISKLESLLHIYQVNHEKFGESKEPIKNNGLPPQPISINESRTKKVIFETLTNLDKRGWQYAFVSEQDYNLFTDLLTNFFEYKPYTLPNTIIKLKRSCKTKVAKALGEIHKELSNEKKLSNDTEYFKIIRVLNHFKNETAGDLYKALTR